MRTGIATLPLDYGRCPRWLFERMKRLARGITAAIIEEFGSEIFLQRLSDPVWFQSLSCVIGMDWNSSGTTAITLGALKVGLFDIQDQLGVYVCGGKRESRKTPEEIEAYGISRGFDFAPELIYASKMAAKVDSSLVQDGYQIYQHNFLFTKSGRWSIVQQGMNIQNQTARRYHWLSSKLGQNQAGPDFIEEPHTGIASQVKVKPLNLTAKESDENRKVSVAIVKEEPKIFLKDIKKITESTVIKKPWPSYYSSSLIRQRRRDGFTEMELNDIEFHWHPVVGEKFDLKRLEKTIFAAYETRPRNFEELLSLKGIGPKTIRALSLVSEIIYGAKPSYEDPARYSFAHGGKDSVPRPIDLSTYSKTIEILEKGIKRAKIENRERASAIKRLYSSTNYE